MTIIEDWNWMDLEEVGSTNDEALAFSVHAKNKKFVITACRQGNGRGRRGRNWVGLEGNLFMSLGLELPLHLLGQLVFVVSLSLAECLKKLAPQADVKIKWPNDVLVGGAKISGILLEKGHRNYVIVGIGVNIKKAPQLSGVTYQMTSLADLSVEIDRIKFLQRFLKTLNRELQNWQQNGFAGLRNRWLTMATGLSAEIRVVQEQTEKRGIFSGVDENGMLLLKTNDKTEKIYAGDVFIIKDN